MRVAIIGAGIVGVATAYELSAAGHEVVVIERHATVASEASFAQSGLVSPACATSWTGTWPGADDAPGGTGLARLPWLWRRWRTRRSPEQARRHETLFRLARQSAERRETLVRELRLDHEQVAGLTVLLRSDGDLATARPGLKRLAERGVRFELVDAARAREIEPGLHPDAPLRAAIYLPAEGVGNGRQFAHLLKREAERLGARFRFEHRVTRLTPGPRPGLELASGAAIETLQVDAVVACAGVDAAPLLRAAGLRLPLIAVHGHSITAPIRQHDGWGHAGPRGALIDAHEGIVISRLGQRVRVAGGIEFGGDADRVDERVLDALYRALDHWFPGAAVLAQAQRWKGARPLLPDGLPVIGASGLPGVWLNLGHGAHGFALACGAAAAIASMVGGTAASAELADLGVGRLR